ncbi:13442_t:CDS:10, partial [Racocetra fulgida]
MDDNISSNNQNGTGTKEIPDKQVNLSERTLAWLNADQGPSENDDIPIWQKSMLNYFYSMLGEDSPPSPVTRSRSRRVEEPESPSETQLSAPYIEEQRPEHPDYIKRIPSQTELDESPETTEIEESTRKRNLRKRFHHVINMATVNLRFSKGDGRQLHEVGEGRSNLTTSLTVVPFLWLRRDHKGRLSHVLQFHEHIEIKNSSRRIEIKTDSYVLKDFMNSIETIQNASPWVKQHQHDSFAPIRENAKVKWYVDGKDYFFAVSQALLAAKSEIYIEDWWLSPELYLRRPPSENEEFRLDRLLTKKAEEGVMIYIIVYKEVTVALPLDSHHTKFYLQGRIAFIGGLDLCFGRYDTHSHELSDWPQNTKGPTIWPGQDYSNPRIKDFQNGKVVEYQNEIVDKSRYPRMPWHDVSVGTPARDVARHFVQRWNFIKDKKSFERESLPFLLPKGEYVSTRDESRFKGTCDVQILRSSAAWSGKSILEQIKRAGIEPENYISFFALRGYDKIKHKEHDLSVPNGFIKDKQNEMLDESQPSHHDDISTDSYSDEQTKSSLKGIGGEPGIPAGMIDTDPKHSYITEEIYIHSKLMIVDDKYVIIGSGHRDSEIAILVEDKQTVPTRMNGQEASKFAYTLRSNLFKEFLGRIKPQDHAAVTESSLAPIQPDVLKELLHDRDASSTSILDELMTNSEPNHPTKEDLIVMDPLSDEFYNYWQNIARNNTAIYRSVFKCIPDDNVTNWSEYENFVPNPTIVDKGHVAISNNYDVKKLDNIRGHLVTFPLHFLESENLMT